MKLCIPFLVLFFISANTSYTSPEHTEFDPPGIFLTFVDDPATSIVIDWHTEVADRGRTELHWKMTGESVWRKDDAKLVPFPFSNRMVHRVFLSELEPASEYTFRFGENSRVFKFRTLPDNFDRPLRLMFGGDIRERQHIMEEMNRQAIKHDPDMIIWGGDLAYADGREDRPHIWYQFFDANRNTLIHDDGRVIPILVGVGNHEVKGGYWYRQLHDYVTAGDLNAHRELHAPYFLNLMAFPGQPGFGVIDLGGLVSFVMLDSDHLNPIAGAQTYWLKDVLQARSDVPWVIPVYHVPAWPSVREFDGRSNVAVREHWVPLFERYNVRVAFEHHDHIYKRTEPIRANQIVEPSEGIVYFGDGAWGVSARQLTRDAKDTWYLSRADSIRHVILMTIHDESRADIAVIDLEGDEVDSWTFE